MTGVTGSASPGSSAEKFAELWHKEAKNTQGRAPPLETGGTGVILHSQDQERCRKQGRALQERGNNQASTAPGWCCPSIWGKKTLGCVTLVFISTRPSAVGSWLVWLCAAGTGEAAFGITTEVFWEQGEHRARERGSPSSKQGSRYQAVMPNPK